MGSGVSFLGEQAAKPKIRATDKKDKEVRRKACCGIRGSKLMTDWLVI
jgi:hypothetical protein